MYDCCNLWAITANKSNERGCTFQHFPWRHFIRQLQFNGISSVNLSIRVKIRGKPDQLTECWLRGFTSKLRWLFHSFRPRTIRNSSIVRWDKYPADKVYVITMWLLTVRYFCYPHNRIIMSFNHFNIRGRCYFEIDSWK